MPYDLKTFCQECRDILKTDSGEAGREKVRQNLERLLGNADFCSTHVGNQAPVGSHLIYRDAETDFCLLVHIPGQGKTGPPHDHGTSWAIYGQVAQYTDMTRWRRTDGDTGEGHAHLVPEETFRLEPGMVGKFEPGEIHSVRIPDGARYVRVTGTDLDAIPTLRFDLRDQTARVGSRS